MASGFTVLTNTDLIRTNLWSRQIKELLLDDLYAMRFVKIIQDFPDGTTLNIPSVGQAATFDYTEGQAVKYDRLDTGNFTFSFDQYKGSAHAISEQFKQDSMYAPDVIAMFVPREHRALMQAVESRVFNRMNAGQTATSLNAINGASHRWIGKGTSNTMSMKDFALANYGLRKALVPMRNLVAVVDPSVAYQIETQANIVNQLSPQMQWESVAQTGMVTGFTFRYNIFGFDVYVSNYLPDSIAETVDSVTVASGVANFFFSAAPGDTMPIVGGFKQMPTVYSEFNKDLQQTEYLTIARYGFKCYRPENLVTVLTDKTAVS